MFEQSLCKSEKCSEREFCMRCLMEERFCFNPVKVNLGNHLCKNANNFNFKIPNISELPVPEGGGIE